MIPYSCTVEEIQSELSDERLCGVMSWAEVHLDRIRHNMREIQRRLRPGVKFMAVVKADGYGHGIVPTAKAVIKAGADALAVGTLDEAIKLRRTGIVIPILVLSPTDPAVVDLAAENAIELTVFQASWLAEMRKYKSTPNALRIHIKMDTGMGRYGLRDRESFDALVRLLRVDGSMDAAEDVQVVGVYTHFATANQRDDTFVREQYRRFLQMREWLTDAGFDGVLAHCANSAAAIRFPELAMDMVRVGASLFGILPIDADALTGGCQSIALQQTLSLKTTITHVKKIHKGQSISYDRSYVAEEDEWIATLPIGYADGWFRGYTGFHVIVDGCLAPIVGNICMNQTMIRLPYCLPVGTVVTLLGVEGVVRITLEDLAHQIGSIPQQVLVMLPERLPRIYGE